MKAYKGGKPQDSNENTDPNLLAFIKQTEKEQKRKVIVNTNESKYSEMLLQLIQPFHTGLRPFEEMQALLDLASLAWNLSNMKKLIPHVYTTMWNETKNDFTGDKQALDQLQKMIKQKDKLFGNFDMFIYEALMNVTTGREIFVTATAKPLEAFAGDMLLNEDEDEDFDDEENFAPGYINRNAFTVTAKSPFLKWTGSNDGTLFPQEVPENSIYLIGEKDNNEAIEEWLKKNYDLIFKKELEAWDVNEKSWPKKRTYAMFLRMV